MAKKTKTTKLTEDDKERLEQIFLRVRDEKLRQWYAEAQSENPNLSASAQSRLQLHLCLREKRKEADMRRQERDACNAEGDDEGAATARKKMRTALIAMSLLIQMAAEGQPPPSAAKARRKWMAKTPTLEEMLGDRELDRRTEFGVTRDSLPDLILHEAGDIEQVLENDHEEFEGAKGGLELEDSDIGRSEPDAVDTPAPEPSNIWIQHTLHMQERYRAANLPDFAIETRLAYQKKLFDEHVSRQQQLHEASVKTLGLGENAEYPMREGLEKTYNSVLATSTYSEDSLWELTSPMLWHYSDDWIWPTEPQWCCPMGTLRIQTVCKISRLYLDFGVGSLSADCVSLPPIVGQPPKIFRARNNEDTPFMDIEISFLAGGFVKVRLPTFAVTRTHMDQRIPSDIELTGVWMGRTG
jgi:hypothetical protein